ncbi:MAG TPA: hypothetical protein EYH34_07300 [Planctomycetes bacterium]|nr:hypothetical protein [Planctomycetota bacterium]
MGRRLRPFIGGSLWAVSGWAALNAVSYFWWSGGWGNLLGTRPGSFEAIGFPWVVWRQGQPYGNPVALAADAGLGLAVAWAGGWVAQRLGRRCVASPVAQGQARDTTARRPLQFSLRGLLAATALVAGTLAALQTAAGAGPVLLGMIYLLGPAAIVALWFQLRHVTVHQRNVVVVATALVLVAAAAVLGQRIETIGDFTKGILGTYVFWTPQCVLVAACVAAGDAFLRWQTRRGRSHRREDPAARR